MPMDGCRNNRFLDRFPRSGQQLVYRQRIEGRPPACVSHGCVRPTSPAHGAWQATCTKPPYGAAAERCCRYRLGLLRGLSETDWRGALGSVPSTGDGRECLAPGSFRAQDYGYHLWVQVPDDLDTRHLCDALRQHGLPAIPGKLLPLTNP
jgi:hypothetical protein